MFSSQFSALESKDFSEVVQKTVAVRHHEYIIWHMME